MATRLPPLNACRAFEAATRLGSFTRAAAELNVTATAVSHHIKVLEAWTGRRLFRRHNNTVTPTDEARQLAPFITEALDRLADGIQSVMGADGPRPLTISVQPHFALKWLIPRLPRFAALYPAIELRLVTGYRALDLINENIDLAVRYLDRTATAAPPTLTELSGDLRADHLIRADLSPVASPALFRPGVAIDPAVLRRSTLLHVLGAPDNWRNWLAAAGLRGVAATKGPKFDSYVLSTEAAVHGWGFAMGRVGFIEADLAAGRLVAPFALRLPSPSAWVLLTTHTTSKPQVAVVRDWMIQEARTSASPR